MIIRPDTNRIDSMYESLKKNAKKVSNMMLIIVPIIMICFPFLISIVTHLIEDSRKLDFDEIFPIIPVFLILGLVIGFVAKMFFHNFILKENATFVSQVKNSGIKIENDLISGRMLKVVAPNTAVNINKVQEVLPRKAFDVAFKISNVSNIEITDKILAEVNYGKFCTLTTGSEKYYLVCLNDADATSLRTTILNYK
ncbi:MAG: hypothetical protein IJ279_05965 [Clostridia bacterium]|nr:hypothetical protein [Clostridia bacterium]